MATDFQSLVANLVTENSSCDHDKYIVYSVFGDKIINFGDQIVEARFQCGDWKKNFSSPACPKSHLVPYILQAVNIL